MVIAGSPSMVAGRSVTLERQIRSPDKDTIETLVKGEFAELSSTHLKLTKKGYSVCDEINATYF
jgi:hypothetical protein